MYKGRDPLDPNSYRGVTLSSVVSKCLEKVILNRMEMPQDFPTHLKLPISDQCHVPMQ